MPRLGSPDGPPAGRIVEIVPAPTKIVVRSPAFGRIVFENLDPNILLGDLKENIRNRLVLPPTRAVDLSAWGVALQDDWKTLQQCHVKNNGQLDMRTCLVQVPSELRYLERVRAVCTALETRNIALDSMRCTGFELKQKIHQGLLCADHAWFDKQGERTAVTGGTLLATANVAANPTADLPAIRLGEELITTIPHLGEMGKGKPVTVIRARQGGPPINVVDTNVVQLVLTPDKQKISFQGVEIADSTMVWALGCRTDDTIELEFESPAVPPILTLLRTPDKPKEKKKGGGKKGKKGKS